MSDEPQIIKNAENYNLADDSKSQIIKNAESYNLPNNQFAEDEPDTREKLEADICNWLTHDLQGNPLYEVFADSVEPGSMPEIRRWLDRQAALDRKEFETILEGIQECMRNGGR